MVTRVKPGRMREFFFMAVHMLLVLVIWLLTATPSITVAQQGRQGDNLFCGPMDIVIVIDETGSMKSAIENIKAGIKDLIRDIDTAAAGDLRLGLVSFNDTVMVRNQLESGNADAVINNIQRLVASGGVYDPEASDEALNVVINGSPTFPAIWRSDARKLIVLVTDAEPGGFDDFYEPGVDDVNAHNRALEAAARGIKIVSVYVPTTPATEALVRPIMQDYAATTSGLYRETASDGSGTLDAIKDLLITCRLRPDVWIKDNPVDVGIEPGNYNPIWGSPDIKVCMGDEVCATHQQAVFGYPDTYIYVRLRNNGPNTVSPPQGATGDLHLYFSPMGGSSRWNPGAPDAGPRSGDWTWINAKYDIYIAPGESERTVRIHWPVDKIPAPGHYCMLARWVSDADPMTFPEMVDTAQNTKNNNNIAWKNFDVIAVPPGRKAQFQYAVRPVAAAVSSDLVVKTNPPFPGTIELQPGALADAATVQGEGIVGRNAQGVFIDPNGGRLVNLSPAPAGNAVNLVFTPDAAAAPGTVIIDVFQEANLPPVQDVGGTRFEINILPDDAPPVAPIAAIAPADDGVAIIWPHVQPNAGYEVWRSDRPDFTPGDPDSTLIGEVLPGDNDGTEALRLVDPDAPTGADAPFYIVRSRNAAGETADSNRVTLQPMPPVPFNVFGTVISAGQPVPDGTQVYAIINGKIVASSPVFTSSKGRGLYILTVPGDIPDTPAIEGGRPRDIVKVVAEVPGKTLSGVTTWEEGELVNLNLGDTVADVCQANKLEITRMPMDGNAPLEITTDSPAVLEVVGYGYRAHTLPNPPRTLTVTFPDGSTQVYDEPTRLLDSVPDISTGMMGYTYEIPVPAGTVTLSADDPDDTIKSVVIYSYAATATPQVNVVGRGLDYAWGGDNGRGAIGPADRVIVLPEPLATTTDLEVTVPIADKDPRTTVDQRIASVKAEAGGVSTEQSITNLDGESVTLVTLTLEDVPAGTDIVTVSLISPVTPEGSWQWYNPAAGDSVFLLSPSVSYPCALPDPIPTATPVEPTATPDPEEPTAEPTATPTATPTPTERPLQPTAEPSATPTATPTERPLQPTAEPSATPTATPTERPLQPSATPTATPTERPLQPTAEPTATPTERPLQPDVSAVITNQGGELDADVVTVAFPPDATTSELKVTYRTLPTPARALVSFSLNAETVAQPVQPVKQFQQQLTITVRYTDVQAAALNVDEADLILAYFDEERNTWVAVQTDQVDTENNLVVATLDHFTDFAVMPRSVVDHPDAVKHQVYLPLLSQ